VSEVEAKSRGSGTRSDVRRRSATMTATVVIVYEVIGVDERTPRRLRGYSPLQCPTTTFRKLSDYIHIAPHVMAKIKCVKVRALLEKK